MNKRNTCDMWEKIGTRLSNLEKIIEKWGYGFMLLCSLNVNTPTYAQSKIPTNDNPTEQFDKLNGFNVPKIYKDKLGKFISNNDIFKVKGGFMFTVDFAMGERENDRGIGKDVQYFLIRHSIYKKVTGEDLYDGQDGDPKLAEIFGNRVIGLKMKICGQKYEKALTSFLAQKNAESDRNIAEARQQSAEARQQSAEARQQSAEYDRQSAEARQQSAEYDRQSAEAKQQSAEYDRQSAEAKQRTTENERKADEALRENMRTDSIGLKDAIKFYNICHRNPSIVSPEQKKLGIETGNRFFKDCEENGINTKNLLLEEVGDEKKVAKILEFYGIKD